jgi:ribose transport system substrate-binding protein
MTAAAVLTISACSSSNNNGATGSSDTSTSAGDASTAPATDSGSSDAASQHYNLTFVQGVAGDAFYITMGCGIQDEATKLGNVDINIQGAQKWDVTLQNPIIQSVTAAKPDAMLVAPNDVKASRAPIKAAMDAGIKVVLVDTTLDDPSGAVSQISSDNTAGGAEAFKAIQQLVPGGGKVLVVNTVAGVSTTDQRQQGFADAAKADSNFNYLGAQFDQDDASIAAQVTTAALQKDPDIVGIFATNLFSAQGVATAIKQAGMQGKIVVVGFDAGPDQVKALQDGTVQALIAQQPYAIGTNAVDQAVAALQGQPTQSTIGTGFTILTKDNLDSTDGQAALYKAGC